MNSPSRYKTTPMTHRDVREAALFMFRNRVPLIGFKSLGQYVDFCNFLSNNPKYGTVILSTDSQTGEITACLIITIRTRRCYLHFFRLHPQNAFRYIVSDVLANYRRKKIDTPLPKQTKLAISHPTEKLTPEGLCRRWKAHQENSAITAFLYTESRFRGNGIATSILRFAEMHLLATDVKTWCCRVSLGNEGSLRLHQKLGFAVLSDETTPYLLVKDLGVPN
jgi:GNAT superfamily N-acetyltransferase